MKYMVHMTGGSTEKIEECLIFGESVGGIRELEDYQDFESDGYTEEASFLVESVSGHECLPNLLYRNY